MKQLRAIAQAFDIPGEFVSAIPTGSGHINDSYRVAFAVERQTAEYILQRINRQVFADPAAVMRNIDRVTRHLAAKLEAQPDAHRRTLTVIPTRLSQTFHVDPHGDFWRAYPFIQNTRSFDVVESPAQAYEAAKAFGQFQGLLADLPAPRLCETIPDFHHTPKRFAHLQQAIAVDVGNRAQLVAPEIEFALCREAFTGLLLDAQLPERITHNDAKFNNVLLDDRSGEALCVIDLDTVMPGLAPYDFGDMVRTTSSPAAEDERDLSRVTMQFPLFEALARGYVASAGGFLTPAERGSLVSACKLITFEQGLRFLADYLAGDRYYKTHRANQNLDRCRTQFKLVASIECQEDAMQRFVESL